MSIFTDKNATTIDTIASVLAKADAVGVNTGLIIPDNTEVTPGVTIDPAKVIKYVRSRFGFSGLRTPGLEDSAAVLLVDGGPSVMGHHLWESRFAIAAFRDFCNTNNIPSAILLSSAEWVSGGEDGEDRKLCKNIVLVSGFAPVEDIDNVNIIRMRSLRYSLSVEASVSVAAAMELLSKRPEKNKMLYILSNGAEYYDPFDWRKDKKFRRQAITAIKDAASSGMNVRYFALRDWQDERMNITESTLKALHEQGTPVHIIGDGIRSLYPHDYDELYYILKRAVETDTLGYAVSDEPTSLADDSTETNDAILVVVKSASSGESLSLLVNKEAYTPEASQKFTKFIKEYNELARWFARKSRKRKTKKDTPTLKDDMTMYADLAFPYEWRFASNPEKYNVFIAE